MIKVKDGYAKLVGATASGSASHILLSNGGVKAVSDFAAASALDNYLPLIGGVLSGHLSLGTPSTTALLLLSVERNSNKLSVLISGANEGWLTHKYNSGKSTALIQNETRGLIFKDTSDNYFDVWHRGNDGSGSGLDADLLDGKQASDFLLAGNYLIDHGMSTSRPNGTTFTLPIGANGVSMRSKATSGADIGIFQLTDDNAFICNSSDNAYLFATFDTDKTADFSSPNNAAFAVLSDHVGAYMKGSLTVDNNTVIGGSYIFAPTADSMIGTRYSATDTTLYNRIKINAGTGGILYNSGAWTSGVHAAHQFLTGGSSGEELVRMVIMNITGNVGIGTTNPKSKLSVFAYRSTTPTLGSLGNEGTVEIGASGSYGTYFWTDGSGRGTIQQGRADGTATAYNLVINPLGGYVGVGTSDPILPLTVNGQERIIASANASSITLDTCALIIGPNSSGHSGYSTGIGFNSLSYGTYINHIHAWIGLGPYTTTATAECYPLIFATNGSTTTGTAPVERMRITPDGNVGIGDSNPAYKLEVAGSICGTVIYANRDGSTTAGGVSLYSNSDPMTYGIAFRGTGTYGTHGYVTAANDWATYLTMSDTLTRGWIFRRGSTNVASIAGSGNMAIGQNLEFSNGAHIATNRSTDYHYGYTFNLTDNEHSIGMYSGPIGEAGGVVVSPDGCLIYNSSDCGYGLQVRDKDLGADLTNAATLTFGIEQTGYYAWSRGGFKKNGSDDSYVLLGGGGHKAVSDFAPASHNHNGSYVYTGGMVNGAYAVIPTYNGETGWHRIATIDGGTGYGSWILYLCGNWSWASNTNAILHINTMHTAARITQVSGIVGFVTDVRLVPISANNYYVDVYVNYSGANTPGTVYCYFLGNGAITTRTTAEKITESVSTAASITLVTGTKTNDSSYAAHFYENSDIRYKTIINNLAIKANQLANLPLFDFKWLDNENLLNTGTSAQAVQELLPYIVSGTDKLTLDYGVLGTIAGITACKELTEQEKEINELKEQIKFLKDEINNLKTNKLWQS